MARTYDVVIGPRGTTIAKGTNQGGRPSGRVLVNSGQAGEVTNRDLIPLIHQQLWTDASATLSSAVWLGGGIKQPATVGASIPYGDA